MANILYKVGLGSDTAYPLLNGEQQIISLGIYEGFYYFSCSADIDFSQTKYFKKVSKADVADVNLQDNLAKMQQDKNFIQLFALGIYPAKRLQEFITDWTIQAIDNKVSQNQQRDMMAAMIGILSKKVVLNMDLTKDDITFTQQALAQLQIVQKIRENAQKILETLLSLTNGKLYNFDLNLELFYEGLQ